MVEHLWIVDIITREAFLFAGVGLLIGGLDDLLVDLVFIGRSIWCRRTVRPCLRDLPAPLVRAPLAIFVPAWDEVAVIGAMLATSVARFEHEDYRIYVGAYPNDRATIDAAAAAAACDPRITVVIGDHDGPTTKADCLNTLWHALRRSDAEAGRRTKAIVLHDAEDVVHPLELRVFDSLIDRYAVVQLPILPLVKRGARLVSGHYADEFAEADCSLPQLAMATRCQHREALYFREAYGSISYGKFDRTHIPLHRNDWHYGSDRVDFWNSISRICGDRGGISVCRGVGIFGAASLRIL